MENAELAEERGWGLGARARIRSLAERSEENAPSPRYSGERGWPRERPDYLRPHEKAPLEFAALALPP